MAAVAIVTGSASGIGRASAQTLARHGASVVVADINLPGAEETVGLIEQAGGKAFATEADISYEESIEAMIETAVQHFGALAPAAQQRRRRADHPARQRHREHGRRGVGSHAWRSTSVGRCSAASTPSRT